MLPVLVTAALCASLPPSHKRRWRLGSGHEDVETASTALQMCSEVLFDLPEGLKFHSQNAVRFLPHPVLSAPYQTPNTLQSTSLSALAGVVVAQATAHRGAQATEQNSALGWGAGVGVGGKGLERALRRMTLSLEPQERKWKKLG